MIGKRFSPAGVRDVIIESGVIEERSVDGILTGKLTISVKLVCDLYGEVSSIG